MVITSILGQLSAKALVAITAGAVATGGVAAAATGSLPTSMQTPISQAVGAIGLQIPSGSSSQAVTGASATASAQASTASGVGKKVSAAASSQAGTTKDIGQKVAAAAKTGAGALSVVSSTPAGVVIANTPAAKVLAGGVGRHSPAGSGTANTSQNVNGAGKGTQTSSGGSLPSNG